MPHHDEEGDTCKKGAAGRRHGEKKDKHHDEEGETCKDGAAGRRHEKKEGEHEHHGKPGHKHVCIMTMSYVWFVNTDFVFTNSIGFYILSTK